MKRVFLSLFTFILIAAFWKVQPVSAGTDISVSCTLSTCTATPDEVPLFSENNIWPGYSVTQQITATNTTDQNGQLGINANEQIVVGDQQENSRLAFAPSSLASKILIEIHQGAANGPIVYGGGTTTLQDFYDEPNDIQLGLIGPTQIGQFFLKATFDPEAENENLMATSTRFDFDAGFNFTPVPGPNGPSGDGGGGGGGGNGGTSEARTPVCTDTPPSGAPFLTVVNVGGGQATLNWSPVAGADHYAINFGIQPGQYIYGNSNVGNVTTYTVTGLTPGAQYFFQVIPINGCAPGPRSNEANTNGTLLPAGTQVGGPAGFSPDQVLGVTTDASGEAAQNGSQNGEVLGTEACAPWKQFLPLIFLAIQIIATLVIYVVFRNPENKLKHIIAIIADVVLAALFYFLRNCDCSQSSILSLLCKWYIVAAIAVALITQFVNYALIEREE